MCILTLYIKNVQSTLCTRFTVQCTTNVHVCQYVTYPVSWTVPDEMPGGVTSVTHVVQW